MNIGKILPFGRKAKSKTPTFDKPSLVEAFLVDNFGFSRIMGLPSPPPEVLTITAVSRNPDEKYYEVRDFECVGYFQGFYHYREILNQEKGIQ